MLLVGWQAPYSLGCKKYQKNTLTEIEVSTTAEKCPFKQKQSTMCSYIEWLFDDEYNYLLEYFSDYVLEDLTIVLLICCERLIIRRLRLGKRAHWASILHLVIYFKLLLHSFSC